MSTAELLLAACALGLVSDSVVRQYNFMRDGCQAGSFRDEASPASASRRMFRRQGAKCSPVAGRPGVTLDAACHPALRVDGGASCAQSTNYLSTNVDPSILEDLRTGTGMTMEMWLEYDGGPAAKAASGEWATSSLSIPGSSDTLGFAPEFSLFSIGKTNMSVDADTPALKLWQQCGENYTTGKEMQFAFHASVQAAGSDSSSPGCVRSLVGRPAQYQANTLREYLPAKENYDISITQPRCFGFPLSVKPYRGTGEAYCEPDEIVFNASQTAVHHVAVVYDFGLNTAGDWHATGSLGNYVGCNAAYGGPPVAIYVDGVLQDSWLRSPDEHMSALANSRWCQFLWYEDIYCAACGGARMPPRHCSRNMGGTDAERLLKTNGQCPLSLEGRFSASDSVLRIGSDGFAPAGGWQSASGVDLSTGNLGDTESAMMFMHPLRGTVYSFAVHNRPLRPEEVTLNAAAGPPFRTPPQVDASRIVFSGACSSISLAARISDFDATWRGSTPVAASAALVGPGMLYAGSSCSGRRLQAVGASTETDPSLTFSFAPPTNQSAECPSWPCCNTSIALNSTKLGVNGTDGEVLTSSASIEVTTNTCLSMVKSQKESINVAYVGVTRFTLTFHDVHPGSPYNGSVLLRPRQVPYKGGSLYDSSGNMVWPNAVITGGNNVSLSYVHTAGFPTCAAFGCANSDVVLTDSFTFEATRQGGSFEMAPLQELRLNIQNPLHIANVSVSQDGPFDAIIGVATSTYAAEGGKSIVQVASVTTEVKMTEAAVLDVNASSATGDAVTIFARLVYAPLASSAHVVVFNQTTSVSTDAGFFSTPSVDLQGNRLFDTSGQDQGTDNSSLLIVVEVVAEAGPFQRLLTWTAQWRFASLEPPVVSVPSDTRVLLDHEFTESSPYSPLAAMTMSDAVYNANAEWLWIEIDSGATDVMLDFPVDLKDDGSSNTSRVQFLQDGLFALLDEQCPPSSYTRDRLGSSTCTSTAGTECRDCGMGQYPQFYSPCSSSSISTCEYSLARVVATPRVALDMLRRTRVRTTKPSSSTIAMTINVSIIGSTLNHSFSLSMSRTYYCKKYADEKGLRVEDGEIGHGYKGKCACMGNEEVDDSVEVLLCIATFWDGPLFWGIRTGDWSNAGVTTAFIGALWVLVLGLSVIFLGVFVVGVFFIYGYVKRIALNRSLAEFLSRQDKNHSRQTNEYPWQAISRDSHPQSAKKQETRNSGTMDDPVFAVRTWSRILMPVLVVTTIMMGIGARSSAWSIFLTGCIVLNALAITWTWVPQGKYNFSGAVCLLLSSFVVSGFSLLFWLLDATTFMNSGLAWKWIAWALGVLGLIFGVPSCAVAAVFVVARCCPAWRHGPAWWRRVTGSPGPGSARSDPPSLLSMKT